jgi:hypothetical protein
MCAVVGADARDVLRPWTARHIQHRNASAQRVAQPDSLSLQSGSISQLQTLLHGVPDDFLTDMAA